MQKKTMAERAREMGITVAQLKAQIKQKSQSDKAEEAQRQLIRGESGPGWNHRAGSKKRN